MTLKRIVLLALQMILFACVSNQSASTGDRSLNSAVDAAVAHPGRPMHDRERDAARHPAEVLRFFGLEPGMAVLDVSAGEGYYTEIVARVVGPTGRVLSHNNPGALDILGESVFEERYGNDRLRNVEQVFAKHNDLELAPDSLDFVLMTLVYHDFYWHDEDVDWGPIDIPSLLANLDQALRSDGRIGVIDHHAMPGTDPRESAHATHRIDPAVVRADFAAAGFELLEESALLENPADDLTRSVFEPQVQGRTSRFVMLFAKTSG